MKFINYMENTGNTFNKVFGCLWKQLAVNEDEDKQKIALFLAMAETDALDVFKTCTFVKGKKRNNFKILLQTLEAKFWSCLQKKVETVDKLVTDLKTKE